MRKRKNLGPCNDEIQRSKSVNSICITNQTNWFNLQVCQNTSDKRIPSMHVRWRQRIKNLSSVFGMFVKLPELTLDGLGYVKVTQMLATWLWRDAVEFARFTAHKGPFSRRFCLEWWRKTHLTFYVMSILKVTHRHLGVKCVLLLIRQRKLRNDWDLLFVCTFSTKGHRYAKEFKVLYSSGMALDFDSVWCLQDVLKCLFYGYEMTSWSVYDVMMIS